MEHGININCFNHLFHLSVENIDRSLSVWINLNAC